jgi:hypothetical protein
MVKPRFFILIVVALIVVVWPFLAIPVQGQPTTLQCAERSRMIHFLNSYYQEGRVGMGTSGQAIMETWANSETGTWTVTMTMATGVMCIIASGQNWDESPLLNQPLRPNL